MNWLNYHHLLYFWAVAREGSIARACRQLLVSQPTVSAQLRLLERRLGAPLFDRVGKRLQLTDAGRLVFQYADEIFNLGRELQDALADRPSGRRLRLHVGIVDALPKLIAYRLCEPALHLPEPVQMVCHDGSLESLLAQLATHALDVVLSDAPAPSLVRVKAYNHLLGECGVSFFAAARLAAAHRRGFPGSLQGAPVLLPTAGATLRRSLDDWFDKLELRPEVAGEFADSALLKVFGGAGAGIFPAPTAVEQDVITQYRVRLVGRTADVRERFYAISVERRVRHRAVLAITQAAGTKVFVKKP